MIRTACNCCGRTYRCPDTDICITCHQPMCPECFRDYSGACCVDPPRLPSRRERLLTRLLQSEHASRQLTKRLATREKIQREESE